MGGVPVIAKPDETTGTYTLTLTGAWVQNKTRARIENGYQTLYTISTADNNATIEIVWTSANVMTIYTSFVGPTDTQAFSDDVIATCAAIPIIVIEVYP